LLTRPTLAKYVAKDFMPLVPKPQHIGNIEDLPTKIRDSLPHVKRQVCIRCFFFYDAGTSFVDYAEIVARAPSWMELVVHEWPSHGLRAYEAPCTTLDALVDDAMKGLKFALSQHGQGGELEGAPFAMIGHGTGAQVMVLLAKRLRSEMTVEPSAVVVMDRAPPDVPLFSEYGQELLRSSPEDIIKAYMPIQSETMDNQQSDPLKAANPKKGEKADDASLQKRVNEFRYACDTRSSGFHSFDCDVLVLRAMGNAKIDEDAKALGTFAETTLKIDGSDEVLRLPVNSESTTVAAIKDALAEAVGVPTNDLTFTVQDGPKSVTLLGTDVIGRDVTVKGLASFKVCAHVWPHPIVVIGAGYQGIKCSMAHLRDSNRKNENIIIFERIDRIGGYCWIQAANVTSKVQTDFGIFHIGFGMEYSMGGHCPDYYNPARFEYHAKQAKIVEHMEYAAEEFGVMPHLQLNTEVEKMDIVGDQDDPDHHYELTVKSLKDGESRTVKCSVLFSYPGSYNFIRQMPYPGEDLFDGQIGIGMGGKFDFEDEGIRGSRTAILGNGAFAVENIRTCLEHGVSKVYIVSRKKNLPSPRIPCWFVSQTSIPLPAQLLLNTFEPMYLPHGMDDPWTYHSVYASKDRRNVTIVSNSRFGITDMTFVASAYGKLEYVVDTVKRFNRHTVHTNTGVVLEGVTNIIKCLGFVGDFAIDRFHHMTEMTGLWCGGDFRRPIDVIPLGMNASNFGAFSVGPGAQANLNMFKWFTDFPEEWYRSQRHGIQASLPKCCADPKYEKPAYVSDAKYIVGVGFVASAFLPKKLKCEEHESLYKHAVIHKMQPFDKYLDYCKKDWDHYQEIWKNDGDTHEYVPYPYTRDMWKGYFKDYRELTGATDDIDGPDPTILSETVPKLFESEFQSVAPDLLKDMIGSAIHNRLQDDFSLKASRNKHYLERAKITSSSPSSAMDFDFAQLQDWEKWSTGKCVVEDLPCDHAAIGTDQGAWQIIYSKIEKVKAAPP